MPQYLCYIHYDLGFQLQQYDLTMYKNASGIGCVFYGIEGLVKESLAKESLTKESFGGQRAFRSCCECKKHPEGCFFASGGNKEGGR